MVYQLEMHITDIIYKRGDNSHMESPDSFGQNETEHPEDITSNLEK